MMALPFILFVLLIFIARSELGTKWTLITIAIWASLYVGSICLAVSPYIFVVAQSLLDIILILVIFGGDIRIR